jgi:hypothetical protein
MGFKDWFTGKKDGEPKGDIEKYFKAMRMTLRDYNVQVSPKEAQSELDRLYDQALKMYGARRVSQTLEGYKKILGIK